MNKQAFEKEMDRLLTKYNVKYFKAYETCDIGREYGGAVLEAPERRIWTNIIPTLHVLDWLREEMKRPIDVNGCFRSTNYNLAVGGASRSLHLHFNAIDFNVRGRKPLTVAKKLSEHKEAAFFGIGLYKNFVHLDTRARVYRPSPARWGETFW